MSEKSNYLFVIILVIVALITGIAGYGLGKKSEISPVTMVKTPNNESNQSDPFYDSQTASINGKITNVNGKTITVTNFKNATKNFELADKVYITTLSDKGTSASPSSDISKIELNKYAF